MPPAMFGFGCTVLASGSGDCRLNSEIDGSFYGAWFVDPLFRVNFSGTFLLGDQTTGCIPWEAVVQATGGS
jgi:hypothetical protein